MASDASPRPTDCNMNKSSVIVVQTLSYYACAEVAYLKRPHPTIIDEDMRWDSGWFWVVWFWGCGAPDTRLARRKLYQLSDMRILLCFMMSPGQS